MSGGGRHACPARSAPAFDPRSLRLERPMPAPSKPGGQATNSFFLPEAHATETAAGPSPALRSQTVRGMLSAGAGLSLRNGGLPPSCSASSTPCVPGLFEGCGLRERGRHLRQPFDHSSMRGPRQPSNEARAPAWPGRGSKRNGGAPPDFSRGLWDASNGQQNNICAKLAFVRRRRIGVTTASAACSDRLPSEQESSHFCTSAGSNRRRGFGPVPRRRAPGSSACSYTNEAPTFSRSATPLTSSMPAFTKPNPALRDCRDRSRLARAGARTAKDVC